MILIKFQQQKIFIIYLKKQEKPFVNFNSNKITNNKNKIKHIHVKGTKENKLFFVLVIKKP